MESSIVFNFEVNALRIFILYFIERPKLFEISFRYINDSKRQKLLYNFLLQNLEIWQTFKAVSEKTCVKRCS